MGIRKRRITSGAAAPLSTDPSSPGPAPEGFDHDVEVLEYDLVGAQFTVDAVVARLGSEGVEIVRSSPFYLNVQAGGIARLGEHKIIFRASDKDAVARALRDAGLL